MEALAAAQEDQGVHDRLTWRIPSWLEQRVLVSGRKGQRGNIQEVHTRCQWPFAPYVWHRSGGMILAGKMYQPSNSLGKDRTRPTDQREPVQASECLLLRSTKVTVVN